MSKRVIAEIIKQEEIAPKHYKMLISAPEIANNCRAGQFLHLKWVSDNYDPLLRRPISINDFNEHAGEITLIYRVVGRGTQILSELEAGDKLDLMGTLGNGFNLSEAKDKAMVVGGGMGLAPLYPVVKNLVEAGVETILLAGAETEKELLNLAEYRKLQEKGDLDLKLATVDGSCGYQCFVTELFDEIEPSEIDKVYTCGPEPMLEVVQDWVREYDINAEASLEERMGCGTGACLSCVCKIKIEDENGFKYKKSCTEGPVFSLPEVIFND